MNFDKAIDRHTTGSVKWDLTEQLFSSQNTLPIWVPYMYFDNPEPVHDQDLKNRFVSVRYQLRPKRQMFGAAEFCSTQIHTQRWSEQNQESN
ncbi:hypothetical protein IRB23M11_07190 [Alkalibacterium sp. m-11]|uniref:Uncharacterized protein n=1 Tax=Alkalibacterium indicireducens TaxID=398758 RepID=A0ABP3L5J0_9LACT